MKHSIKSARTAATALFAIGSLAGGANGATLFTQSGNNLTVTITSPISFTVTTNTATPSFLAIRFIDVFSAPAPRISSIPTFNSISISSSNATPVTTSTTNNKGVFNFGQIDANDFAISWSGVNTVLNGDFVTISTGSLTLTNYFPAGTIPNITVSSVQLTNRVGNAISNIVTIPEPSSALLLGLGSLGLVTRRRRTK